MTSLTASCRRLIALVLLPLAAVAQAPDTAMLEFADQARAAAEAVDAELRSPDEFAAALSAYAAAQRDLEKGRDAERIRRSAGRAEELFRAAELNAIRAEHLSLARNLLAQAHAARTDRSAPRTTARAEQLLASADALLVADRYDTAPAVQIARQAEYEARHAMRIGEIVEQIRDKELTAEDVIIDWEEALRAISGTLGIDADLLDGPDETVAAINRSARELLELPGVVAQQRLQIQGLEEEIRDLDARLGGAAADRAALVRQVERQARIREQFEQIEGLFGPDEAIVLRDGDDMIIRLVGLAFPSNSADIEPEFAPLMAKVDTAIRVFPQARLRIEGHTDSQGKVERNHELSEERARAVMDYMTGTLRIPAFRVRAAGFGDTRPIASNRTEAGRAQNRRIDLIITPSPESLY